MKVLAQADPRWSKALLLDGTTTIGRAGCVLASLVEAARRKAGRLDLSIPMLNELAVEAGACSGAKLDVEQAAQLVGLDAPYAGKVEASPGDARLQRALERALAEPDGGALVRVDHDGDGKGDHTIFAFGWSPNMPKAVLCTDSAPAKIISLSWPALTATVMWGKTAKHYRVTAVHPVRRHRATA